MKILVFGAAYLSESGAEFLPRGKGRQAAGAGSMGREHPKLLRPADKFSPRDLSVSRIPVTGGAESGGQHDVIFVVLRYTQLRRDLRYPAEELTKNIVFVGNDMRASAERLPPEKNVMFASCPRQAIGSGRASVDLKA